MKIKLTSISVITLFSVFLAAGSVSSAFAATTASGTASLSVGSSSITLQLGNKNVAVAALQKLLMQQGYLSVGAPTGYFGSLTQAAVVAFQKAHNITPTGMMTIPASAIATLFADAALPSVGNTGTQVNAVQQFLIQHGYLSIGKATGYFGALTKTAVMAFQKAKNIPQTGIVDKATSAAMGL